MSRVEERASNAISWLRRLIALVMVAMGTLHFAAPDPFVAIVPDWLPAPLALVYVSGVAEFAFGMGLLFHRTRRWASIGLIALLIAVFPANVHMAVHEIQLSPGGAIPVWAMWARLPLQGVFIWAVWRVGLRPRSLRSTQQSRV